MDDLSQDELLSAYLDGEVTPQEREQVERWLAESPEARQTLEELRNLSAAVQSLPKAELGEDLADSVLRLAERRMLTTAPQADDSLPQPAFTWAGALRRVISPRNLSWSIAAITVALVVSLLNPQAPVFRHTAAPVANTAATGPIEDLAIGPKTNPASRPSEPSAAPASPVDPGVWNPQEVLVVDCVCTAAGDIAQVLRGHQVLAQTDEAPSPQSPLAAQIRDGMHDVRQLVYADATEEQLEAVLAELARQRESVASLTVVPAPAMVAQRSWLRFNRAAERPAPLMIADGTSVGPSEVPDPQHTAEREAGVVHADNPAVDAALPPSPSSGGASLQIRVNDRGAKRATTGPPAGTPAVSKPPKATADRPASVAPTSGGTSSSRPRYRTLFVVRVISGS